MLYATRIVIFGALGRTGLELVNQALGLDHNVAAFVRNSGKFQIGHKNLSVFEGDVLNKDKAANAVNGCEGVLFAVGGKPWEKRPICTEGIKNVIAVMQKHTGHHCNFLKIRVSSLPITPLIFHICPEPAQGVTRDYPL